MTTRVKLLPLAALLLVSIAVFAQFRGGRYRGEGNYSGSGLPKTARDAEQHSNETPMWTNAPGFQKDTFTFCRIRYSSSYGYGGRSRGGWSTDFPDADLNLSYRLQQMTSLKVNPLGRLLQIEDPDLFNYPWTYMVEVGALRFTDEEIPIMRKYLLNGGFLMVDDFWGEAELANFIREIKRVLPEREAIELEMDHPIFHSVFDIKLTKNQLQCPNIGLGTESQHHGITWEREDARDVHFKGIFDDKGRMMVFIAHNTDNGDGWEREGENEYYFKEFSEKRAYPLGINVIFYAMTH
ncbi:MAG: transmembrane prediction [Pedosphaera sp.]|nr:DUF4159 domain-containing protein [Pedosphaera sp.]PHX95317.1 MAG: transmembrane prediction [Pedosphaera sp.]